MIGILVHNTSPHISPKSLDAYIMHWTTDKHTWRIPCTSSLFWDNHTNWLHVPKHCGNTIIGWALNTSMYYHLVTNQFMITIDVPNTVRAINMIYSSTNRCLSSIPFRIYSMKRFTRGISKFRERMCPIIITSPSLGWVSLYSHILQSI